MTNAIYRDLVCRANGGNPSIKTLALRSDKMAIINLFRWAANIAGGCVISMDNTWQLFLPQILESFITAFVTDG